MLNNIGNNLFTSFSSPSQLNFLDHPIEGPNFQMQQDQVEIENHQSSQPATIQLMKPNGFIPFNKFMLDYELFIGSKGYNFKDLKFILRYNTDKKFTTKDGNNFEVTYFNLIEIYDSENNSLMEIDHYLDDLKGLSLNKTRGDKITSSNIKHNPFVIHNCEYGGTYMETYHFYKFIFSPLERSEIAFFNRLCEEKMKKSEVMQEGATVTLGIRSKRRPPLKEKENNDNDNK